MTYQKVKNQNVYYTVPVRQNRAYNMLSSLLRDCITFKVSSEGIVELKGLPHSHISINTGDEGAVRALICYIW